MCMLRRGATSRPTVSSPNLDDLTFGSLIGDALARGRWAVLGTLFVLSLTQPTAGRTAIPTWGLILIFISYNALIEAVRRRAPALRPNQQIAIFDLPAAALLYALGSLPGGPLFVLFLVAVTYSAASMSLRGSLMYTAATAMTMVVIAPTLPHWAKDPDSVRTLGAQVVIVSCTGVGAALLMRQLLQEHARAEHIGIAAAREADLNRLRERFLASVTHDLRTPLATIQAGLGLLAQSAHGRLHADETALVANLQRNAKRLDLLINDLLTLNQLEAGALHLDRHPIDLRLTLAEAATRLGPLLARQEQTLTLDLPTPLSVEGDERRLDQVFANIVANAHQHTDKGTHITITGEAHEREILVTIHDTGSGIPPDELESIFLHFHHLSTSDAGSGLGLAIARAVVDLHGGRIWAESALGQGTDFFVALPRTGRPPAAAPHENTRDSGTQGNPCQQRRDVT